MKTNTDWQICKPRHPPTPVPLDGDGSRGTCGRVGRDRSRASSGAPACVHEFMGWVHSSRRTLHVGGSTDRSEAVISGDTSRVLELTSFEGDHFKCSFGAMIEVARHGSRGDVEPLFQGSCWRWVIARCGFRGVRVGEASHPGPRLLRRLGRGWSWGARAEISDEEVLARHSHRHERQFIVPDPSGEQLDDRDRISRRRLLSIVGVL